MVWAKCHLIVHYCYKSVILVNPPGKLEKRQKPEERILRQSEGQRDKQNVRGRFVAAYIAAAAYIVVAAGAAADVAACIAEHIQILMRKRRRREATKRKKPAGRIAIAVPATVVLAGFAVAAVAYTDFGTATAADGDHRDRDSATDQNLGRRPFARCARCSD